MLTCYTPAHADGFVNVAVANEDYSTGTGVGIFEYLAPITLAGVSPEIVAEPELGTFATFRVTGTGFTASAFALFSSDGINWIPASTTIQSTSALDFQPMGALPPGTYSVKVNSGEGYEVALTDCLTVVPRPTLSSIDPEFGPAKGGTIVTVTGDGFLTDLSGTLTFTQNSKTVTGSDTAFVQEIGTPTADTFIRLVGGDWVQVASLDAVEPDTKLILKDPYPNADPPAPAE
ncbi:unnamed protein product, partial [marine sediment metagenome]